MSERVYLVRRSGRVQFVLGAFGFVGLGVVLGGWGGSSGWVDGEQPGRRSNTPATEREVPAAAGQVTGLAADSRGYLYRTFASGRVERLLLGAGVDGDGTTAEWELFKR